jgi:polygalacturonase
MCYRILPFVLISILSFPAVVLGMTLTASKEGVVADGATNNALAIQAMIDQVATAGGGRVMIDQGVVVSGKARL